MRCPGDPGRSREEVCTSLRVVFVRRGAFVREVRGVAGLADPATFYLERDGDVERFEHPCGPDTCTTLAVEPGLLGSLADPDRQRVVGPFASTARLDVAHRTLVVAARQGAPADELAERALALAAVALAEALGEAPTPAGGRRARRLAGAARAPLAADLDMGLVDLARTVGVSPYGLSRTFRAAMGVTLSRYRRRLRVRRALDLLEEGEANLAFVAVQAGFADQAHMTRAVREECGRTPGRLRLLLGRPALSGEPTVS